MKQFTPSDWLRQALYTSVHCIDWGQTLHIAKNPQLFHETNLILGLHPSVAFVSIYFASTLAGHWIVARYLTRGIWRQLWQYGGAAVQTYYIIHNYQLGIKIDF